MQATEESLKTLTFPMESPPLDPSFVWNSLGWGKGETRPVE